MILNSSHKILCDSSIMIKKASIYIMNALNKLSELWHTSVNHKARPVVVGEHDKIKLERPWSIWLSCAVIGWNVCWRSKIFSSCHASVSWNACWKTKWSWPKTSTNFSSWLGVTWPPRSISNQLSFCSCCNLFSLLFHHCLHHQGSIKMSGTYGGFSVTRFDYTGA